MFLLSPTRLLGSTALLGAAILGLTPGRAGAFEVLPNPCAFGSAPGEPCLTNAPLNVASQQLTLLTLPSGSGTIQFLQFNPEPPGFILDVDFEPALIGPSTGFLTYKIAITAPNQLFDIALPFLSGKNGASSLTEFFSDAALTTLIGSVTTTLDDTPSYTFTAPITEIWVKTSWLAPTNQDDVSGFGSLYLQRAAQSAAVPGPLPLFGAAAAFGMSRRLRRRIQLAS